MEKVAIPPARVMRILWFGFVLAGFMFIYIAIVVPIPATSKVQPAIEVCIAALALVDVVLGFFVRKLPARFLRPVPVPGNDAGSVAISRWLSGNMVSLAFIFSCNVFAVALRMTRARVGLVELLFGVGMTSLLLWQPGTPPTADEAGTTPRG